MLRMRAFSDSAGSDSADRELTPSKAASLAADVPSFNRRELRILAMTWCNNIEEVCALAENIYCTMFTQESSTRRFFIWVAGLATATRKVSILRRLSITSIGSHAPEISNNNDEIYQSPQFQRMTMRMVQILQNCVKHSGDLSCVAEMLESTGRDHVAYSHGRLIRKRHWNAMECAINLAVRQLYLNSDARDQLDNVSLREIECVWTQFIGFMVERVKRGYKHELYSQKVRGRCSVM